jgi:uncharacterized protein
MNQSAILFFLLAFICEVIGTIGGFGSSVFFVPMAQFFFNAHLVLAITGVFHVFSNISKIWMFKSNIDKKLSLLMGIPSIIFVIIGAFLITKVGLKYDNFILGLFLIIFSLIFIVYPKLSVKATNTNAVFGGGLAGFLAGFVGTGGAVRGAVLAAFNLEKNIFVGTSAAIDMGVDISRSLIYLGNGFLEKQYYIYIPFLLIVSFIGSYLGKLLLSTISQEQFKNIVLYMILLIGIVTLTKPLFFKL